MKVQKVDMPDPALVVAWTLSQLHQSFAWSAPWHCQVSTGLVPVLAELFAQIETVLGPAPELAYLQVFDEGDDLAGYQRKLAVFIEPNTAVKAQRQAIDYFVLKACDRAKMRCCRCGRPLFHSQAGEHYFWPKTAHSGRRAGWVCLACMEYQYWQDTPAAMSDSEVDWDDEADGEADFDPAEVFGVVDGSRGDTDSIDPVSAENQPAATAAPQAVSGGSAGRNVSSGPDHTEGTEGSVAVPALLDTESGQTVLQPRVRMFEPEAVAALKQTQAGREKPFQALLKQLEATSADKRLALQPDQWRDCCQALETDFPNFAEVVEFIRHQMALAACKQRVFALPPMILIGPPGIGKTEFLLTLATVAHSVLEVIDIASAQTGSALSGSEAYWSNSQPGQLFKLLALGEVANPIVLLEEIDKARKDQVYKPIAALHQLLEPRQAKCFKDLSVPSLPLDASRVIWVASGNELDGLEKPILDRFVVFQIERPSAEQMRVIAQNQYRKILAHHAPSTPFEPLLTEDSLTALTAFSPRQVRKLLESALGRAAYQERQAVSTEDIRHCSRSLDRPKASIGFI